MKGNFPSSNRFGSCGAEFPALIDAISPIALYSNSLESLSVFSLLRSEKMTFGSS